MTFVRTVHFRKRTVELETVSFSYKIEISLLFVFLFHMFFIEPQITWNIQGTTQQFRNVFKNQTGLPLVLFITITCRFVSLGAYTAIPGPLPPLECLVKAFCQRVQRHKRFCLALIHGIKSPPFGLIFILMNREKSLFRA